MFDLKVCVMINKKQKINNMIYNCIVLLNNKIINIIYNYEYKKVVVIECDNCIYCLISLVFGEVGCNK